MRFTSAFTPLGEANPSPHRRLLSAGQRVRVLCALVRSRGQPFWSFNVSSLYCPDGDALGDAPLQEDVHQQHRHHKQY